MALNVRVNADGANAEEPTKRMAVIATESFMINDMDFLMSERVLILLQSCLCLLLFAAELLSVGGRPVGGRSSARWVWAIHVEGAGHK